MYAKGKRQSLAVVTFDPFFLWHLKCSFWKIPVPSEYYCDRIEYGVLDIGVRFACYNFWLYFCVIDCYLIYYLAVAIV